MTDTEAAAPGDTGRITAAIRTALASSDRADAWRLVEIVAADWSSRPLGPGDGCTEAELDAAAARLGLPLPAALREAFVLFGRRDDLTRNQNHFETPAGLDLYEGALLFRTENQGVCFWGVLIEDLGQDDPPTYFRPDLADKSQEAWEPWTERLSLAIAETVLSETVIEDTDLADGTDDFGDFGDAGSPGGWQRLPSLAPDFWQTAWYLGPDLLAFSTGDWISLRARTPEALAAFIGDDEEDDEHEEEE